MLFRVRVSFYARSCEGTEWWSGLLVLILEGRPRGVSSALRKADVGRVGTILEAFLDVFMRLTEERNAPRPSRLVPYFADSFCDLSSMFFGYLTFSRTIPFTLPALGEYRPRVCSIH